MDILLMVLGIVCLIVGLIGCVLPFLPGPPIAYAGLLMQQLKSEAPFSTSFLLWWAAITIAVTILDYVVPAYGTKRFGGSKYGMWGSAIGVVAGLFFPPWGLILGPFVGAFVGEMMANNDSNKAMRAAWGSFIGFLFGTLIKVVVCIVMIYYFFALG
ncbi:MAG: DUF456 domain-containing protein [Bacteroidia bacterium]|nr:DUF456 domain-containing protein [Bacteroidia bacterium]